MLTHRVDHTVSSGCPHKLKCVGVFLRSPGPILIASWKGLAGQVPY